MDAVNSRITSEKESATAKVDRLDSKGREIVEEVRGYLSSFGSLCDIYRALASRLHIAAIPHSRKMKIITEIQSFSTSVASCNFPIDFTFFYCFLCQIEPGSPDCRVECHLRDCFCIAYCDSE